MRTKTTLIIIFILIIGSTIGGALLLPQLPPQMASHWNADDQVDGTIPRFWGVFLMPIITLLMTGLFLIIPRIDPLATNIERFRGTFNNFVALVVIFMVYIYLLTLIYNLGYPFAMSRAMLPALGLLIFAAGILVGKAQPNWFIGIRTPWTLSNNIVWEKTHHLGGVLFKVAGVLTIIGVFWGRLAIWYVLTIIIMAALAPAIYSYIIYHSLMRHE